MTKNPGNSDTKDKSGRTRRNKQKRRVNNDNNEDTAVSAISAKVALGELLRLCPGSSGLSTSIEKAKTDCHDKARVGRCSRGLESLKTYAA